MNDRRPPLEILRDAGLGGLPRKALLYLLRRAHPQVEGWLRQLDFDVATRSILRRNRPLLATNAALRHRHEHRRCFVIGNGPSLSGQDLGALAGEITFVTNAFWKHPIVELWQPTYYVLTDPLYFNPDFGATMSVFFRELSSRIHTTTFLLPLAARTAVDSLSLLKARDVQYVGMAGSLAHTLRWQPDLTQVLPGVRNVVQLAMIAAIYMGCSPIYLLGLDHDWLAHRGRDRHFYQGSETDDPRIPRSVDSYSYRELMEYVLIMWRGYEAIRRVADAAGVSILNTTPNGFLDVFERTTYDSALAPVEHLE